MTEIAVIISTWNRENFVAEAVESILRQMVPEGNTVRAIAVDDGSTDRTVDRLISEFRLKKTGEPNIFENDCFTLIAAPNRERGAARNTGAAYAIEKFGAEWLMFLDSDDTLAAGSVAGFLNRLKFYSGSERPVCVYANSLLWYGGEKWGGLRLKAREPEGDLRFDVLERSLFSIGAVFICASAFAATGGFPEERRISGSEDWVLHSKLCFSGPIAFSPHVSLNYRRHEGNTSAERFFESIVQSRLSIEAHLPSAFGASERTARRLMWRHAWLSIAGTFNSVGQSTRAARVLSETLSQDPALLTHYKFWRLSASIAASLLGGSRA